MRDDDTKLIEYAMGLLDEDECRALREKLEDSPDLERNLGEIREALSSLSAAETPLRPSAGLRGRVLSSISDDSPFEGFVDRLTTFFDLGAERVRSLLGAVGSVPDGQWDSALPGAHLLHFDGGPRVATADCGLVYVEANCVIPLHRHNGDEWTLVVGGRFEDGSGQLFGPGDLCHRPPGSIHTLTLVGEEPLLFAVVVHKGVEWL